MITAFLTKYNGEVEVREGLNFEEFNELQAHLGSDYIDIEMDDGSEEDEILLIENSSSLHFI